MRTKTGGSWRYGLLTGGNQTPNGILHGRVLVTFADRGLADYAVAPTFRKPSRCLICHSGQGELAMDTDADPSRGRSPLTLAIDIGGTKLKAGLLDRHGTMVAGPNRVETPPNPTPQKVVDALIDLSMPLGAFDRVSIGFPGVVRQGQVLTAPNLGTPAWRDFPLAASLAEKLGKPTRMLNDAEVQGLGVITGTGLECVITLGTGMGFALFQDGRPAPHLELSHHPVHKGKTYDQFIGHVALKEVGRARWNRRLRRVLACITTLVGFDVLLIGGGNAKQVDLELAPNMRLVSNEAGITGGVQLWNKTLDLVFVDEG